MFIFEPPWCCKSSCISSKRWILFHAFLSEDHFGMWAPIEVFMILNIDATMSAVFILMMRGYFSINSDWGTFRCFQGVAILLLIWFGEKRIRRNFVWLMIGKSVFVKDKGFCLVLAYKEVGLMFQNLWFSLSDPVKDDWSPLKTLSEINPNKMKQFSSA